MAQPHQIIETRYADEQAKQAYLRRLFNEGARDYDRMGWIGSLGTGHAYRRWTLQKAGLRPGMAVLDVACGTGAVTRAVLEVLKGAGSVVGMDPSAGMLAEARTRVKARFVEGEAEALPFADASFDFLTMGYALRHVGDLNRAFAEYRRVLRPGGRVLLLEITRPEGRLARSLTRVYFRDVLGSLARLTGRTRSAREMMTYYWETIEACVPPDDILGALRESGFSEVQRRVCLGLFSEYQAQRGPDAGR